MSEQLSMWGYWKEEYVSMATALERQYPSTLKQDEQLRAAVTHIRLLEKAIDSRMGELSNLEADDYED